MSEFTYIYVFFVAIFLCLAIVILIKIRDKKDVLVADRDFISVFLENKDKQLKQNLPNVTLKKYLILTALCPVAFGTLFWMVFPNKMLGITIAIFTVLLPEFVVQIMIESKKKKYEENYVRALKTFSSALRSGMSLQQSVREVVNNQFLDKGIRESFRQIDADITVGISIKEAFARFAEAAGNQDAYDVSAAIAMQTDVGGSEAKVIDSIALNIEERLVVRKEIRSVFAGTDFMIKAFDILPFLVLVLMNVALPDYMAPILSSPLYTAGLILLLGLTVVGSFYIRKTVRRAKGE